MEDIGTARGRFVPAGIARQVGAAGAEPSVVRAAGPHHGAQPRLLRRVAQSGAHGIAALQELHRAQPPTNPDAPVTRTVCATAKAFP